MRIPEAAYRQVEAIVAGMSSRARHGHRDGHRAGPRAPGRHELQGAYRALGVSESDSDAVVKRAYRRLISKHHPDKLVSKGLPEDMMRVATQRTAEIKASYDLIMASRASAANVCRPSRRSASAPFLTVPASGRRISPIFACALNVAFWGNGRPASLGEGL